MPRRIFPSILLYGFGLVLALSLLVNGFCWLSKAAYEAYTPMNWVPWPARQIMSGNRMIERAAELTNRKTACAR